jgi:hypothetical protein
MTLPTAPTRLCAKDLKYRHLLPINRRVKVVNRMEILPLHRALHRTALRLAEAAAQAHRCLALLGGAERAKPVTVEDGLCEQVAVAGGRCQQTAAGASSF